MARHEEDKPTIAPCLGTLAPNVREAVESRTNLIHGLLIRTGDNLIAIAGHVAAVKELIGTPRLFKRWYRDELQLSNTTVWRMLLIWKRFGHASKREPLMKQFTPTALYRLAHDSCSENVFEACISLAESGQKITGGTVEEAMRRLRSSKATTKPVMPAGLSRLVHWVTRLAEHAFLRRRPPGRRAGRRKEGMSTSWSASIACSHPERVCDVG